MDTQRATLKIQGMDCAHCALAVEKALSKLDGVVDANVNFTSGYGIIEYALDKISLEQIKKAIKEAGYKVVDEKTEENIRNLKFLFVFGLALTIPIFYIDKFVEISNKNLILFVLTTPIQFVVGYHFYRGAYYSLKIRAPNLDLLVVLSTSAAYFYSVAGTFVFSGMSFYEASATITTTITCGKLLESFSRAKASESIKKLIALQPNTARIIKEDKEIEVSVNNLAPNDIVVIKPGERISADGTVLEGYSFVDESMLTGESAPIEKNIGSKVFAGTINQNGMLKFKVEKAGENATVMQIVKLVEEAQGSKAPLQRIADKVVNYFVPLVVAISLIAFLCWYFIFSAEFAFALTASIAVLVVACPCALGLATPMAVFVASGKSAEHGILIKGGEYLEKICAVDTIVFDKTGTLTKGKLEVADVLLGKDVLKYAAIAERYSEHPIGEAILRAANFQVPEAEKFQTLSGKGIIANYNNQEILVGNIMLMDDYNIKVSVEFASKIAILENEGKTVVIVAVDKKIIGIISVADMLKANVTDALEELKNLDIDIIMLTGDNERVAKGLAAKIGISKVLANVLPDQKLEEIKKLQAQGKTVAMVGDGINDAPALTQADIGFAIGSGTDIAIESGNVILMKEDLRDVVKAIKLSNKTMTKIKQNLIFAFAYNLVAIPLAAGAFYFLIHTLVLPTVAAIAMVLSDIVVVGNSLLLKKYMVS